MHGTRVLRCTYTYAPTSILTHGSLDLTDGRRVAFSAVLVGNQIDSERKPERERLTEECAQNRALCAASICPGAR